MITVRVNESQMEVDEKTTISSLLQTVNSSTDGIAVAINHSVIPKDSWGEHFLNQHDTILIIKATQGG